MVQPRAVHAIAARADQVTTTMTDRPPNRTGFTSPAVQRTVVFSAAALLLLAGTGLAVAAGPTNASRSLGTAVIASDRPIEAPPSTAATVDAPSTATKGQVPAAQPAPRAEPRQAPPAVQRSTSSAKPKAPKPEKPKAKAKKKDDDERETVVPPVRDDDDDDDDEHETVLPPVRDDDEHDDD